MNKLLRRPILCCLILSLTFLIFRFLQSENFINDKETARPAEYLKRDYVLFDDIHSDTFSDHKKSSVRPNTINIYKQTLATNRIINIQKVYLRTLNGKTPIFVYSSKVDNMISAHVKTYGTWEEDLLNQTGEYLKHRQDITLIDIGCNIGVYTLFAAKLGIKVISVDPVENNLILLSKSVNAGKLTENVTLILNAVSDEYKSVHMNIPKDNVGGAHIVDNVQDIGEESVNEAETILLDDLIPYIRTNSVFMKMDVEGHEWKILKGGHQFFQTKNVKVILMEWVHHRHNENGPMIIEQLMKNGFLPYIDILKTGILNPDDFYTWPENVFWIKR